MPSPTAAARPAPPPHMSHPAPSTPASDAAHNPVMLTLRRFNVLILAVLIPLSPALAQDTQPRTHEEMHGLHRDPKAYIAMLENPARDAYQKPDEVVRALALKRGETVADIGSGSGYFTLRLA